MKARNWRIFGVMMIGVGDGAVSVVNLTIPELQTALDRHRLDVVVDHAYNIAFAVLLVSMGRLADQFGRRPFFLIGLSVFTVGSALCAEAFGLEGPPTRAKMPRRPRCNGYCGPDRNLTSIRRLPPLIP